MKHLDAPGPRARNFYLLALAELVVVVFCLVAGDWWSALAFATVALLLAMAPWQRRDAYRGGWRDGRIAIMGSLHEALVRGMDYRGWMIAELERDGMVEGEDFVLYWQNDS